jgi:hypothetical protein
LVNRRCSVLRVTGALWISVLLAGCGANASTTSRTAPTPKAAGLATACAKIPISRLRTLVRTAGGGPQNLRRRATGSELSHCSFKAPGVNLQLSLDANHDAVRGYFNRMTELSQFSSRESGLRPQPVPGIGDRGTSGFGANWVPAFDQLFSVRRRQALIATFFVRGAEVARLRAGAIALTRLAYAALGSPRASGSG